MTLRGVRGNIPGTACAKTQKGKGTGAFKELKNTHGAGGVGWSKTARGGTREGPEQGPAHPRPLVILQIYPKSNNHLKRRL